MKYKVFIDGREGTTGLQIQDRLQNRDDIELLLIPEELRKDTATRKEYINKADFVFLCLPDDAAREAVTLIENDNVRVIDASTAHRTEKGWVYGLPELKDNRSEIAAAKRVAVPGCYATGFNTIVYPLVNAGVLSHDYPVICHAVSGYSGGGKKMIAEYEADNRDKKYDSARHYAMGKTHKHIKEMMAISELNYPPTFCPYVADYYAGMVVSVAIPLRTLQKEITAEEVHALYKNHYTKQQEGFVKVMPFSAEGMEEATALYSNNLAGTNNLEIFVFGNDDYVLIMSRLDNLGKGASGAAVQCLNIMMNTEETKGL